MSSDAELILQECHEQSLRFSGDVGGFVQRAREGDESARAQVLAGLEEIAVLLALRLRPRSMRPVDAMQLGVVVLQELIDGHDVDVLTELAAHLKSELAELQTGRESAKGTDHRREGPTRISARRTSTYDD